jgi:hypothetical protein
MLMSEILKEEEATTTAPKLVQVLRTLIGQADQKGEKLFLHYSEPKKNDIRSDSRNINLNKLMQNVGSEQFDYETFKAAYDTDARVKSMIANFNEKGIVPKTKDVADKVKERVNELLAEQQSPVSAGELDKAWTITYNPGGWQALHSHAYRYNIISSVLYFDTNENEDTSDGAFYSIFSEPDGEQMVQVCPYWAGKFLVMEGAVYHGAYPTTSTRRCLIIDFKQEVNDLNKE